MPSLLIKNIKLLVGVELKNKNLNHPLKGKEMADLPTITDAFLLIENGKFKDFGAITFYFF